MHKAGLTVAQVAQIANCYRNTVLRWEAKGVIHAKRDINGYRRFSLTQALKLKEIITSRTDAVSPIVPTTLEMKQVLF